MAASLVARSLMLEPWPGDEGYERKDSRVDLQRKYRNDPLGFLEDVLDCRVPKHIGGAGMWDVVEAFRVAWINGHARVRGEPCDEVITAIAASGSTSVGKTYVMARLMAFSAFAGWDYPGSSDPRLVFAGPDAKQVRSQAWTYFRDAMARIEAVTGERMGQMYELRTMEWKRTDTHRAFYQSTDAGGVGAGAKSQGLHPPSSNGHPPVQVVLIEEAEGVGGTFYGNLATAQQHEGRVGITLLNANPTSDESPYYRQTMSKTTKSFMISAFTHPNVVRGESIIPGAVGRLLVDDCIDSRQWARPAEKSEPGAVHLPWRGWVLGIRPEWYSKIEGRIPPIGQAGGPIERARYDIAITRPVPEVRGEWCGIGIDPAGGGVDEYVIWACCGGVAWKVAGNALMGSRAALGHVKALSGHLLGIGVRRLSVRVDKGGGYDLLCDLEADDDLRAMFEQVDIVGVDFGGTPAQPREYRDQGTELFDMANATLSRIAIVDPPDRLGPGLHGRRWHSPTWPRVNYGGEWVLKIEAKKEFKARAGYSPDDGDAFIMAIAPEDWKRVKFNVGILA